MTDTMRAFLSSRHRWVLVLHVALAAVLLLVSARTSSAEGDLVIVVSAQNGENPGIAEVKKLFLGDTTFWSGNVPVKLFSRPTESPAAQAFFRAIQVAPPRFKRMWQEKQLSGQGTPPETVADPAALIAKIAADPGGIGFALSDELPANPAGVRVITLK
jgi:ABC-type phosphate transport system substrate-binding protein